MQASGPFTPSTVQALKAAHILERERFTRRGSGTWKWCVGVCVEGIFLMEKHNFSGQ